MKLETKFDLGQQVWRLLESTVTECVPCVKCAGTGKILTYDGKSVYYCREQGCDGGRTQTRYFQKFTPVQLTVGQVTVKRVDNRFTKWHHDDEESYMCEQTGVGSGSVWSADKLYGSLEEAEKAAEIVGAFALLDVAFAMNKEIDEAKASKAARLARIEAGAVHDDECEAGNAGCNWALTPADEGRHKECMCIDRLMEKEDSLPHAN